MIFDNEWVFRECTKHDVEGDIAAIAERRVETLWDEIGSRTVDLVEGVNVPSVDAFRQACFADEKWCQLAAQVLAWLEFAESMGCHDKSKAA